MLVAHTPALILAPMEGVTDAPMRAVLGEVGGFTFSVSEFLRVSHSVLPKGLFRHHVPELATGGCTYTGLPVQVQILGGDAGLMAASAIVAYEAGAKAIDINFGCPARTVNRHDGGATLLKYPKRIREIVAAVRSAVPPAIPVSAKLRLGWDSIDSIFENASMAMMGGASWLTIHGRTRAAGYAPPIHWEPIGRVREQLGIPVVANGDIRTLDDFRRCREVTGCQHFMVGRGALADPHLPGQIAQELGIATPVNNLNQRNIIDWPPLLQRLILWTEQFGDYHPNRTLCRLKQWLSMAAKFGSFADFEAAKRVETTEELFAVLARSTVGLALSHPPFIA